MTPDGTILLDSEKLEAHLKDKWMFSKHPTATNTLWSCGCGRKGLDKASWLGHNDRLCNLQTKMVDRSNSSSR